MRHALALCAALAPAPALSQGFEGIYEFAMCSPPPGEVALVISGDRLTRYDTGCTLSEAKPLPAPPGAVSYRLTCDGAPEVVGAALWFNADGDLILRIAEVEERYVRCTGR
jgi:hypothetical protein